MKLSIHDLTFAFSEAAAPLFSIAELDVPSGTRLLIQGPSGKGKTTLLHLMAGLMQPTRGLIKADDRDLAKLSHADLCRFRRDSMGLVFQKLSLLPHLVQYNLSLWFQD